MARIAAKPAVSSPGARYFRNLYDPTLAYVPRVAALLHFFYMTFFNTDS